MREFCISHKAFSQSSQEVALTTVKDASHAGVGGP